LEISPEIAETLGVLIGDGCVFRYGPEGDQISGVAFTAHESEFWYYRDFIQPTVESVFQVHGRLRLRNDHTTRFRVYSKRLVTLLIGIGIPSGKKGDACIPEIVISSGLVTHFIRGHYHAEGSIYRRYAKRYKHHARVYSRLLVIQFRMKLRTLMGQLRVQLLQLGILCNRLTAKDGVYTLRVTDQTMIRKFMEVIQPRYKLAPRQANNPLMPKSEPDNRGPVAQPG
jgi:hypothetical protein